MRLIIGNFIFSIYNLLDSSQRTFDSCIPSMKVAEERPHHRISTELPLPHKSMLSNEIYEKRKLLDRKYYCKKFMSSPLPVASYSLKEALWRRDSVRELSQENVPPNFRPGSSSAFTPPIKKEPRVDFSHHLPRNKNVSPVTSKHLEETIRVALELCTKSCCLSPEPSSRSSQSSESAGSTGSTCNEKLFRPYVNDHCSKKECVDCKTYPNFSAHKEHTRRLFREGKDCNNCCGCRAPSNDSLIKARVKSPTFRTKTPPSLPMTPSPEALARTLHHGKCDELPKSSYGSGSCSCPQCVVNREFLRRESTSRNLSEPSYSGQSILEPPPTERYPSSYQSRKSPSSFSVDRQSTLPYSRKRMSRIRKVEETLANEGVIPTGPNRSRIIANMLERRRVAELNTAFDTLRNTVPNYGNEDRNLSKIKTLRYAMTYMIHLMELLNHMKENEKEEGDGEVDFLSLYEKDPMFKKCQEHLTSRKVLK